MTISGGRRGPGATTASTLPAGHRGSTRGTPTTRGSPRERRTGGTGTPRRADTAARMIEHQYVISSLGSYTNFLVILLEVEFLARGGVVARHILVHLLHMRLQLLLSLGCCQVEWPFLPVQGLCVLLLTEPSHISFVEEESAPCIGGGQPEEIEPFKTQKFGDWPLPGGGCHVRVVVLVNEIIPLSSELIDSVVSLLLCLCADVVRHRESRHSDFDFVVSFPPAIFQNQMIGVAAESEKWYFSAK